MAAKASKKLPPARREPDGIVQVAATLRGVCKPVNKYIKWGKLMQNAYIERFNKTYREGIVDAYLFDDLEEVRAVTAVWLEDYNNVRPHDALDGLSPRHYRRQNDSTDAGCSAPATSPLHNPYPYYQDNRSTESLYF